MLTMRWLGVSAAYYCNQSYQHMHAHTFSAKGRGQNAEMSKKLNMKWGFSVAKHPVQAVFWKLKKLKIPFPQYFYVMSTSLNLTSSLKNTSWKADIFNPMWLFSDQYQIYIELRMYMHVCFYVVGLGLGLKSVSKISQKLLKELLQNLIECGPE